MIESGSVSLEKFFFSSSMRSTFPSINTLDTCNNYLEKNYEIIPTTFVNLNILYLCIFLYIIHASKSFVMS